MATIFGRDLHQRLAILSAIAIEDDINCTRAKVSYAVCKIEGSSALDDFFDSDFRVICSFYSGKFLGYSSLAEL